MEHSIDPIQSFRYKIHHTPIKRLFDIFFSLLTLALLSPLFLFIAVIVKCSSPGKIFYKQKRIGRGGVPFFCYKFRTMYQDADAKLSTILKSSPHLAKEWKENHKLKNDPRVTPVGHFLRKTSLDELPQFFNALKGDLSIVGPRPVVQEEIETHFKEKAAKILSIRPGITGKWQVTGRSNISYSKRIRLEEEYIDKHSFSLDLKLIFKTVPKMIFSKGAY